MGFWARFSSFSFSNVPAFYKEEYKIKYMILLGNNYENVSLYMQYM